jgi:hypothetical protein
LKNLSVKLSKYAENYEINIKQIQYYTLAALLLKVKSPFCLIVVIFTFLHIQTMVYAQNNTTYFEPMNMELVNSKFDDFAPNIYRDNTNSIKLIFNSTREKFSYFYTSEINSITLNINEISDEQLKESNSLKFNSPQFFSADFNIKKQNQSYITFEGTGKAYLSKFVKQNGKNYLNIQYSIFKKQNWSDGLELETFKIPAFCSHPTISPAGDYIIFTSTHNLINLSNESYNSNKNSKEDLDENDKEEGEIDKGFLFTSLDQEMITPELLSKIQTERNKIDEQMNEAERSGDNEHFIELNSYLKQLDEHLKDYITVKESKKGGKKFIKIKRFKNSTAYKVKKDNVDRVLKYTLSSLEEQNEAAYKHLKASIRNKRGEIWYEPEVDTDWYTG